MKTVSQPTPYGYSLFCDDIRREVGGKLSYMGIYRRDLVVHGTLPAAMPKLSIVVHYCERPNESEEPLTLKIFFPGDEPNEASHSMELGREVIKEVQSSLEPALEDPIVLIVAHAEFPNLILKEEGLIKVRMYRGDQEIKLGALQIKSQPSQPVALQQ